MCSFYARDDGRKNRLKHVEGLTGMNKLWNVASCWLYCANVLAMHGPMNIISSSFLSSPVLCYYYYYYYHHHHLLYAGYFIIIIIIIIMTNRILINLQYLWDCTIYLIFLKFSSKRMQVASISTRGSAKLLRLRSDLRNESVGNSYTRLNPDRENLLPPLLLTLHIHDMKVVHLRCVT